MENVNLRVLLVEDSESDAKAIYRELRRYPFAEFQLEVVGSTRECAESIKTLAPDIVLLDNGLPGENGLSFLRRVGRLPGMPPIIMLTGQGDDQLAIEAIRQGAYDYFPKDSITSGFLGRTVHLTTERFRVDSELSRGNEQVIFALAEAVEGKDRTTAGHLQRMESYATQLGLAIGVNEHDAMILRYGAIMHDIGKISVSESILRKGAELTEDEWVEMRKHPIIGESICVPLRFADEIGLVIRHHHERWDGTGYVDRLAGQDIPFLARLVSVVDAFDAMTGDRPYRSAFSIDEAAALLQAGAGVQWDARIVSAFLDLLRQGLVLPEGLTLAPSARSNAA